MATKGGECGFQCVCRQTCTKVDPFLKILDLADIGLKIYRYLATKFYTQVVGVAPLTPGTGTDVFILQNTQDKDLPSSSFIQGLDANKISCPKCKQVVTHAKRIIESIPTVNRGNVVGVCDHCRKRAGPRRTCDVCDKIVQKFVSSEDKRKEQRPLYVGRSHSEINLKNIKRSPERMKYRPVAAVAGYFKPKFDDSFLDIRKLFDQKLPCFFKSQHADTVRDELRKYFQKPSLMKSRSETFIKGVPGLTEEILDKTFQYHFPKGARHVITGRGEVSSEEFIRDTQENYRLLTETRETIHEGIRRSGTAGELGSQEYYDQYGQPIRVERMPEVYYDQYGQLVRRGKAPHVYYDKHGQTIPEVFMPDIYYDKYGQPVQGGQVPEVFYDEHGQPVPAGLMPVVIYNKHGQPIPQDRRPEFYYDMHGLSIPEGQMPEVYYDKQGKPIPRKRMPEIYYDKHGKPIPEERMPEVYYDKHGKPIQRRRPPEVYYDKHRQPALRGKSADVYRPAEVYYDEHGQPVTRAKLSEIYYDKHGQPIQGRRTPEVYYDKHGKPVHEGRTGEVHYDKDGQTTRGERTPDVNYAKHERPIQGGTKGGHNIISEVFYDQHGKPVKGGRKGGHMLENIYDQHGKPVTGGKSKGASQKGLVSSTKLPEPRGPDRGLPSSAGGSELDDRRTMPRMGRYEQDAKKIFTKKEDKEKAQIPSKGDTNILSTERDEKAANKFDKKLIKDKDTSQKPSKGEKEITSTGDDERRAKELDKKNIEDKGKKDQLSSKVEKDITPTGRDKHGAKKLDRKIVEDKYKTQIPSKGEKNIPSKDEEQKIMSQVKITSQRKAISGEIPNQEKSTDKSTKNAKNKVESKLAGKSGAEKENVPKDIVAKQKKEDEHLKKQRLEEAKKLRDLAEKNKLKESEEKDLKKIKTSRDEPKDKNVKQNDGRLGEEKQKDNKQEKIEHKRDRFIENTQKEVKQLGNNQREVLRQKEERSETEDKQKGGKNVFEDKLSEARRLREEQKHQEHVKKEKEKEEKHNIEAQKAEKRKQERNKEKEANASERKQKEGDPVMKVLDQQTKQKLKEELLKKANEEPMKSFKEAIDKTVPQSVKISEGTEKSEHQKPFKIDEKLISKSTKFPKQKRIETPNKELDIKAIQIRKPSHDDFIARLVKVKSMRNQGPPKVTERQLEFLGKVHKSHADDGQIDSQCNLCVYSELQLQLDDLNQKKLLKEKKEVIIGNEVKKVKDAKVLKEEEAGPLPALFKTTFSIEPNAGVLAKSPEVPPVVDLPKTKQKSGDQEPKGVIKYALSDRLFIDKGWTLLPTEKVVRKMNVYRMRPAHPEFDWFEHNKNKRYIEYDSGEKLAEFDDNGRGRWFYKNGRVALDYYDAEETNAHQRFVIYSSGEPDERGRTHPYTVLASFDHLGNGIVFDHGGKIRLKYNQSEGVVLDRSLGPVSHWKWHSLNDPPVLQQVMIDTQMSYKDPEILKLGDQTDTKRPDNEEMLAIEFDNFIKEKSKKLTQKFKPFQIKMKALKINEQFSLRILDQATIYLMFRDGTTNLKLNMGMLLDHQEIVDTDTAEMGDVANNIEKLPARTDSIAALQANVANAQRMARLRLERDRRLRPPAPRSSADQLRAAASRPLRQPIVPATAPAPTPSALGSTTAADRQRQFVCRKPSSFYNNLYYETRII